MKQSQEPAGGSHDGADRSHELDVAGAHRAEGVESEVTGAKPSSNPSAEVLSPAHPAIMAAFTSSPTQTPVRVSQLGMRRERRSVNAATRTTIATTISVTGGDNIALD